MAEYNFQTFKQMNLWFNIHRIFFSISSIWSNGLWSNGLVVKELDSQSRGPVFKTTGGSKVDSAFHPSEVNKVSTRNFWELSGKK